MQCSPFWNSAVQVFAIYLTTDDYEREWETMHMAIKLCHHQEDLQRVLRALVDPLSTATGRYVLAMQIQGCVNNTPNLQALLDDPETLDLPAMRMQAPICVNVDLKEPDFERLDLFYMTPGEALGSAWDALCTCAEVAVATQLGWDCMRRNQEPSQVLLGPLQPFYADTFPHWFSGTFG